MGGWFNFRLRSKGLGKRLATGKWSGPQRLTAKGGGNYCIASLVPVGNRIYHQGGAGCRTHGSCLAGIEPDARVKSVGMIIGE